MTPLSYTSGVWGDSIQNTMLSSSFYLHYILKLQYDHLSSRQIWPGHSLYPQGDTLGYVRETQSDFPLGLDLILSFHYMPLFKILSLFTFLGLQGERDP